MSLTRRWSVAANVCAAILLVTFIVRTAWMCDDAHGIADQRIVYVRDTGLLKAIRRGSAPELGWELAGRQAAAAGVSAMSRERSDSSAMARVRPFTSSTRSRCAIRSSPLTRGRS
jgi:hypothetical protein